MKNADKHEEWARLIIQNYAIAIENAKRRQWALTNYILLLFAAIVGFGRFLRESPADWCPEEKAVLICVAGFISILGTYHVFDNNGVQAEYRQRVKRLYNDSYYQFLLQFDPQLEGKKENLYYRYFKSITIASWLLISSGFSCVVYYFLRDRLPTVASLVFGCLVAFFSHCWVEDEYERKLDKLNKVEIRFDSLA
jgi:membrane protein YdbS with pleckstrin-like domain